MQRCQRHRLESGEGHLNLVIAGTLARSRVAPPTKTHVAPANRGVPERRERPGAKGDYDVNWNDGVSEEPALQDPVVPQYVHFFS